ncbi:MAG: helix-turn-helix domain-containing protein [Pseudomonadota bacterium]
MAEFRQSKKLPVRTPAQVQVFVEVLGVKGAIAFLEAYGGTELHISARPTQRSDLVKRFGQDKADALAERADEIPRRIPSQKPWIAQVLLAEGQSVAQVARRLRLSDVTVRKHRKALEKHSGAEDTPPNNAPRQLRLL